MVKVHELWYDELPILFPCHKQLVAKSQGRWPKKSLALLFRRSWVAVSWVKNTNKFLRLTLEIIHNQVPVGMLGYRFGFACVSVHVQFFNGFGRSLHVGLHCDDADSYFSDWIFLWIGVSPAWMFSRHWWSGPTKCSDIITHKPTADWIR